MFLDFPIIDAHFHLWDVKANSYPWLAPGSPRPALGDHTALMRSFQLADYLAAMAPHARVAGGLHVEANCTDPLAETDWVGAAGDREFRIGHIAHVDLTDPEAAAMIARHAARSVTRGVRQRLNYPRIAPRPGIADEPVFRRNFAALAGHNLSFALSIYPPQAAAGARLARDFAATSIVVDHLGWPRIAAGLDSFVGWRAGMAELAAQPNVSVKLSMLWPIDREWRPDVVRPFVLETLALFGPARVMFGSNYPVETVMCTVARQFETLAELLDGLTRAELELIFYRNASRLFRL